MSHASSRAAVTLAALALAACASVPKVNMASEEAAVRAQDQRLMTAVNSNDGNTVAAIYAPDAYMMVPNAPLASGNAAVRDMWTGMMKMPGFHLSFAPTRVDVSKAGDMAMDVGTYHFMADMPSGHVDDTGKYTTVYKKIDGQWRLASDIFNSDMPLPAPPPVAVVFMDADQAQIQSSAGMQWSDFQLPGFAPGVKLAVLHGDPSKKGDYTLRLRFPDNYTVPPHWHPGGEHLTVLQGSFSLGMGNTFDKSALKAYGPGDFVYAPAKMAHYAWTKGETVVQLHGDGPFQVNLIKP